jgi:prepilin-type N-terminal cleavage/methylation domain-containing protein
MIRSAAHNKSFLNKLGFTMIEFSIVLTIIALLISVITTSRILINKAKAQKAEMVTKSAPVLSILNKNGDISAKLWLEASLPESYKLLNDEYVEIWYDKSPYGNDVTNGTNINYLPKLSKRAINNTADGLYFDGNDQLYSEDKVPLSFGDDTYTIVAVWNTDAISSPRVIWEQNSSELQTGVVNYLRGGFMIHSQIKFSGENSDVNLAEYSAGISYISILIKNDKNFSFYNLNDYYAKTIPYSTNLYTERHSIGRKASDPAAIEYFIGDIAEIIVFDKTLNSTEVEEIQKYLFAKYNLKRE